MTLTFNDYIHEFSSGRIDKIIYPSVIRIVKSLCLNYPPEIYSPESVWSTSAMQGLADEFFVEILLNKGRLSYHLITKETVQALERAIAADFRNYLRNKKRRSEAVNLYKRLFIILSDKAMFCPVHNHPRSSAIVFGLNGKHTEETEIAQQQEEVTRAMFKVDLPPLVKYRPDSKKSSHLISNTDLRKLIVETFLTVDKTIQVSTLMDSLTLRLGIPEITNLSLEDSVGTDSLDEPLTLAEVLPAEIQDIEKVMTAEELADDIFECLSNRQRVAFHWWFTEEQTLEQIGRKMSISKSTVHNEMGEVEQIIKSHNPTTEEAKKIFENLASRCKDFFNAMNKHVV